MQTGEKVCMWYVIQRERKRDNIIYSVWGKNTIIYHLFKTQAWFSLAQELILKLRINICSTFTSYNSRRNDLETYSSLHNPEPLHTTSIHGCWLPPRITYSLGFLARAQRTIHALFHGLGRGDLGWNERFHVNKSPEHPYKFKEVQNGLKERRGALYIFFINTLQLNPPPDWINYHGSPVCMEIF